MSSAAISTYHLHKNKEALDIIKKKRERLVNQCKTLSEQFWTCAAQNLSNKECGPQYFNVMKCLEKLN